MIHRALGFLLTPLALLLVEKDVKKTLKFVDNARENTGCCFDGLYGELMVFHRREHGESVYVSHTFIAPEWKGMPDEARKEWVRRACTRLVARDEFNNVQVCGIIKHPAGKLPSDRTYSHVALNQHGWS